MSPEEQRLLANNLINILLGRGLPKERCLLDSDAPSVGSTPQQEGPWGPWSPSEENLIAQGMRNSGKSRAEVVEELLDFGFL